MMHSRLLSITFCIATVFAAVSMMSGIANAAMVQLEVEKRAGAGSYDTWKQYVTGFGTSVADANDVAEELADCNSNDVTVRSCRIVLSCADEGWYAETTVDGGYGVSCGFSTRASAIDAALDQCQKYNSSRNECKRRLESGYDDGRSRWSEVDSSTAAIYGDFHEYLVP